MSSVEAVQSATTKPAENNSNALLLQRKCACGGSAGLTGECSECKTKRLLGKPLQTKLRINEPGDEYEQEADRVAEQVMRMPDRKVSAENSQLLATPFVQRREGEGGAGAGEAPPIVREVLSSDGQPLDIATRAYFEPRFGHDFSRVRVHADSDAAASARAIRAHAYSVGNHVVLDARGYSKSNSADWRRLLAHELTHVVQQTGGVPVGLAAINKAEHRGSGPGTSSQSEPKKLCAQRISPLAMSKDEGAIQRKDSQPEIDVAVFNRLRQSSNKSYQCSDQEKMYIEEAFGNARRWLDTSIVRIKALTSSLFSFSKLQEPGRDALEHHFKSSDRETAVTVLLNLEQIRGNIPTKLEFLTAGSPTYQQNISIGSGPPVPITINAITCHGTECKPSTGAYYRSGVDAITFCPYFFSHRKDQGPGLLVHEIAHSLGFGGSILDFAYGKDRLYAGLTVAEALLNADSYANLVEELATGKVRRMTVPKDTLGKCPDDWAPLVHSAIARAHQWARVAEKLYSGPSNDPKVAYQKVKDGLEKPVRIGCRASGAPACIAGTLWFHQAGDKALYLCPAWRALPDDEPRAVSMLAGLIGYFDGPGQEIDWERYALDASALTRSKLYPIAPSPAPSTGHP